MAARNSTSPKFLQKTRNYRTCTLVHAKSLAIRVYKKLRTTQGGLGPINTSDSVHQARSMCSCTYSCLTASHEFIRCIGHVMSIFETKSAAAGDPCSSSCTSSLTPCPFSMLAYKRNLLQSCASTASLERGCCDMQCNTALRIAAKCIGPYLYLNPM